MQFNTFIAGNFMNYLSKFTVIWSAFIIFHLTACAQKTQPTLTAPLKIKIIIGSVRDTDTGKKIATNIKNSADKNQSVTTEIVHIKDFNLPLYVDPIDPGSKKTEITDPILKKWSDTIKSADAYIILVPEYNSGYPGSLKNALDSIYTELHNKPVAFVGYSGGPSGGASAIAQLKQVITKGFRMITITTDINIPHSWKAFNEDGTLITDISQPVNTVIDQLIAAYSNTQ
jgi:NAD(P)H-dependent FMN reductase